MKKTICFLALGILLIAQAGWAKSTKPVKKASHASASESGDPKNLVSISPMIAISSVSSFGTLIGYERAIGDSNSIIAQVLYQSSGPAASNLTTLGIGGGYRWYLIGGGLNGLYAGPKILVESSTFSYEYTYTTYVGFTPVVSKKTATSTASLIKVVAEAGYQAKVWESLFVGANLELAYTSGSVSAGYGLTSPTQDGTTLGTYATVGWGF